MLQGISLRKTDEEFNYYCFREVSTLVFQLMSVMCLLTYRIIIADDRGGVVFCCVSLGRFPQQVGQETCVKCYHQNACEVIRDGSCQPRELYGSLIETFSKDRDLIIDIGNAFNGKLNYHAFIFHERKMVYM